MPTIRRHAAGRAHLERLPRQHEAAGPPRASALHARPRARRRPGHPLPAGAPRLVAAAPPALDGTYRHLCPGAAVGVRRAADPVAPRTAADGDAPRSPPVGVRGPGNRDTRLRTARARRPSDPRPQPDVLPGGQGAGAHPPAGGLAPVGRLAAGRAGGDPPGRSSGAGARRRQPPRDELPGQAPRRRGAPPGRGLGGRARRRAPARPRRRLQRGAGPFRRTCRLRADRLLRGGPRDRPYPGARPRGRARRGGVARRPAPRRHEAPLRPRACGYRSDMALTRESFPVLQELAYLNAGSVGPLATEVVEAGAAEEQRALREGRGGHAAFERLLDARERARTLLAELVHAEPAQVALTSSTTDGCQIVLAGLDLGPEDEIVTTDAEHFGLLGPVHASGARVRVARTEA